MGTNRCVNIAITIAMVWTTATAADRPTAVKLCHEDVDVYPWVLKDRAGLNIVHLRAVEQKLGVKLEISPLPWKRCQESMREGKVDGIFAASFKIDRMEMGHYPMLGDKPDETRAMMYDGYSLYRIKGGSAQWDGTRLTVVGSVGAQSGYSIIEQLKQLGAKVDDGTKTAEDTLRKLLAGRIDAAALQTLEGDNALSTNAEFAAKVEKVSPALVDKPFFLMLSKQFVGKYADFSKEIWKTVADVRESADYKNKMRSFK